MKIERNKTGMKIKLQPYKINIKQIQKPNKTTYQYSSIIPSILCSYFNITDTPNTPEDSQKPYTNLLMFYTLKKENLIISGNSFYKAIIDNMEYNNYNMVKASGYNPKQELVNYVKENPLNYKLWNTIHYMKQYNTTVYKLPKSNNYKVTLPRNLFKHHIQHNKDNYIQYCINTDKEDLQNNKGVVTYTIIN